MSKSPDAFRTISEVADWLGVQAHVLRFWESKFSQVKPVKRAGGRRYYRPADMQLIGGIKKLLHDDGMTIKGVQKMLREQGIAQIAALSQPLDAPAPGGAVVDETVVDFPLRAEPPVETVREPEPEPVATPVEAVSDPLPEVEPEVEASEAGAEEAEAEPELSFDAPEESVEPEPEAAEEPLAASAPEAADDSAPRLPSFLHRERAAAPEEPAEPAEPDTPESLPKFVHSARRAAPPPEPRETEIKVRPGALSHLGAIERLTPEQAARIAPVAAELRAWLDRASSARVS